MHDFIAPSVIAFATRRAPGCLAKDPKSNRLKQQAPHDKQRLMCWPHPRCHQKARSKITQGEKGSSSQFVLALDRILSATIVQTIRSALTIRPGCQAKALKSNRLEQQLPDAAKPQFLLCCPLRCMISLRLALLHSRHEEPQDV